ncbi:MAG: type II toxin-antitoxin system RelE/ParE family toxin [Dysgonamonadaceae bacterium]|jgi:hypothetical protein|nr:type II toxin-antitoxin system RelE/ParE family toxin [Dysgonamonadaceae bacterium]
MYGWQADELKTLVDTKILKLKENPDMYAICRFLESNATKTYRQINLKKFPYIVLYSVSNNYVKVLKIIHEKRNPKKYLV